MKTPVKIILLFFFSFCNSQLVQACMCGTTYTVAEKTNRSEYVALVKVVDIVSNGTRENYTVITEELVLYKGGTRKEIIVYGSNRALDSSYYTTCDLNIRKGQEWLLFGTERNNKVYTDYCSGSFLYKDELGYRALLYSNSLTNINEINKLFKRPIIDFSKKNGSLKLYYPNGQIEFLANFKNNLRDGVSSYYYPNGVLQGEEYYKQGKLNGTSKRFFREGTLDKISHFENGIEVDSTNWYEFNKDSGRYYMWLTSFNDKKGRFLSSKSYSIPIKFTTGPSLFNSDQFYLQSELIYDTVRKETTHISYHPNGRMKSFYKLTDDNEYVGDEIQYDDKGYVIRVMRIIKGEKDKLIYIDKNVWPNAN